MEIPDEYAKNWIEVGYAALAINLPATRGYGVPIDTVFPRSYAEYTRDEIVKMGAAEQHEFIKTYNLEVPGYKKSMKAAELEKALLAFLNFATE